MLLWHGTEARLWHYLWYFHFKWTQLGVLWISIHFEVIFAYQCVLSIVGEDLMYSGRKTMFPCRCFYLLSSCRLATGDQCLVRCVCYHVKNNFNNLNIVSKRFQTCCWWTAKKLWTICWWKDYCVSLFTWPFCWRTVVFIDVHTCTAVPAVCATHHQYGRVHRV